MVISQRLARPPQDAGTGHPASCRLILNLLFVGYWSSAGTSDGWEEEAQPRVVGQPTGGAGVRREWPDFHAKGALVLGSACSYSIIRPSANRGEVIYILSGCKINGPMWLFFPITSLSSSIKCFEVKGCSCLLWSAETGDVSEGGDLESPEVVGGDTGAGETDEDV